MGNVRPRYSAFEIKLCAAKRTIFIPLIIDVSTEYYFLFDGCRCWFRGSGTIFAAGRYDNGLQQRSSCAMARAVGERAVELVAMEEYRGSRYS